MTVKKTINKTIEKLLSIKEVSEILGVSERTIYTLKESRKLKCVPISARCVRFDPKDVQAYIESCKQ